MAASCVCLARRGPPLTARESMLPSTTTSWSRFAAGGQSDEQCLCTCGCCPASGYLRRTSPSFCLSLPFRLACGCERLALARIGFCTFTLSSHTYTARTPCITHITLTLISSHPTGSFIVLFHCLIIVLNKIYLLNRQCLVWTAIFVALPKMQVGT